MHPLSEATCLGSNAQSLAHFVLAYLRPTLQEHYRKIAYSLMSGRLRMLLLRNCRCGFISKGVVITLIQMPTTMEPKLSKNREGALFLSTSTIESAPTASWRAKKSGTMEI